MEKFECADCGCYYNVEDRNEFKCPNCNDIKISKLGKELTFVSGIKYYFIDYAIRGGDTFTKGTKIIFNDPDDGEEFIGEIEWIIILEDNSIEVSIKDISYGRVDIDILELY